MKIKEVKHAKNLIILRCNIFESEEEVMEIIFKIIEFVFIQLSNWIGVFSSLKENDSKRRDER